MSAPTKGQFEMNALTDIEKARYYSTAIEDTVAERLGVNIAKARQKIAGRLGTTPETLRNIRKLRTKIVPSWLMDSIRAEFASVLTSEVIRLEHEISIARRIGTHHSDDDLAQAASQVVEARKILEAAK